MERHYGVQKTNMGKWSIIVEQYYIQLLLRYKAVDSTLIICIVAPYFVVEYCFLLFMHILLFTVFKIKFHGTVLTSYTFGIVN